MAHGSTCLNCIKHVQRAQCDNEFDKVTDVSVTLDEYDSSDFLKVADHILQNAPEQFKAFIKGQLTNTSKAPRGRWDPAFINFSLVFILNHPVFMRNFSMVVGLYFPVAASSSITKTV